MNSNDVMAAVLSGIALLLLLVTVNASPAMFLLMVLISIVLIFMAAEVSDEFFN